MFTNEKKNSDADWRKNMKINQIVEHRKTYKDLNNYNHSIFPSDPTGSLDAFIFGGVF